MNPKAIDNGLSVQPWQLQVTKTHQRARSLVVDLRTVKTLTSPRAEQTPRSSGGGRLTRWLQRLGGRTR
jgi:hypothetical protein